MASPTNPLAALMPQPYLDFAASPLGPALRRQPLNELSWRSTAMLRATDKCSDR